MPKPARVPKPLHALADASGIQTAFVDSAGKTRHASPDTLRSILAQLGVAAESDRQAAQALAEIESRKRARCIDPVIVAWDGKPARVELSGSGASAAWRPSDVTEARVVLHGAAQGAEPLQVNLARALKGGSLVIPPLPLGYHTLQLQGRGGLCEALVISAPAKSFSQRNRPKQWGVFLPLHAAQSNRSWGAGDFTDAGMLARRVADLGGSVVSTLPLMAAFLDKWKTEPSPYSPCSRLFWNEFYVDPTAAPEFEASAGAKKLAGSRAFQRDIDALQRSSVVDYEAVMALKRRVLSRMAADFFDADSARRRAFDEFVTARPEVQHYADFRAACEAEQQSWRNWPERMRRGALRPRDYRKATRQYHLFAQWLAQQQVDRLLAACTQRGVDLYLDLPLGVNPDGFDVWREQGSFALGASVGAPPDAFFTKGQDWGFPPLHPERIRETGYRYVIEYLRFQMRHCGMLRLDHVMGLHRLWWVPQGASAAEGAYVRYHAEELYAILCLESHRHNTTLVGENLGTVPPEVNDSMTRHGVRTMYVVQYEVSGDAKKPLREPPQHTVASLNTHDMPTWASYFEGHDVADRRDLGLLKARDVAEEAARRAKVLRVLGQYLKKEKILEEAPEPATVLKALLQYLGRSKAELVLVSLEDLWLEKAPQNTPGTSTERINWRRKTRFPLETIFSRPEVGEAARAIAAARTL